MLPIERTSIEPMALALDGGDIQAMPQWIGQGPWDDEALLEQPWRLVDETLGEVDGVCIVEGSGGPMPGNHSVGVARQGSGRLGKVDNGQAGCAPSTPAAKGLHGLTGGCICSTHGAMRRTVSGGTRGGFLRTRGLRPGRPGHWRCGRRGCRPAWYAFAG
jgi:hypothetical protein